MRIIEGKYNGFCFGVKSAVEAVETALQAHKPVYTYGPIIHNTAVVDRLRSQGAWDIENIEQIPQGATVVIRSHGVPPSVYEQCRQRNLHVIDATCPFVARIQKLVKHAYARGEQAVSYTHLDVYKRQGWISPFNLFSIRFGLCSKHVNMWPSYPMLTGSGS